MRIPRSGAPRRRCSRQPPAGGVRRPDRPAGDRLLRTQLGVHRDDRVFTAGDIAIARRVHRPRLRKGLARGRRGRRPGRSHGGPGAGSRSSPPRPWPPSSPRPGPAASPGRSCSSTPAAPRPPSPPCHERRAGVPRARRAAGVGGRRGTGQGRVRPGDRRRPVPPRRVRPGRPRPRAGSRRSRGPAGGGRPPPCSGPCWRWGRSGPRSSPTTRPTGTPGTPGSGGSRRWPAPGPAG